jgi:hypothetical protein
MGDLIVILIVLALVWLAVRTIRKTGKQGGCHCGCSGCGKADHCGHRKKE